MSSGADVADLARANDARHIHLPGNPPTGAMRNAGCEVARGAVVAHFDDDDWSHAERLNDCLRRMFESGRSVCGYSSMRFTDGERWWLYRGAANYALGTSLVYRRDWWANNRFLDLRIDEDGHFVRRAARLSQLATSDAGEMMWATIHRGNTSPRQLSKREWTPIEVTR